MSNLGLILRARRRIVANHLRRLKRHVQIHLGVFLFMILAMLLGGFFFFRILFNYLEDIEVIGPALMDNLVGLVFMGFFSMLVFSNLIVTLSTAYISREVSFYMALPVERPAIFFLRFVESIFYSSWAFAVLCLPLIAAFGAARHAPFSCYALTGALIIPFLLIPAGFGALLTMTLSSLFPARKAFRMALLLGALGMALAVLMVRLMGLRTAVNSSELQSFREIQSFLRVGDAPILPSAWLMQGMLAATTTDLKRYAYWFALLAANALFLFQLCAWLAPRLYYRGWLLAGESSTPRRRLGGAGAACFNGEPRPARSRLDSLLSLLRPPVRAIVNKDVKTFWRDPAQWSQLMILFGLLFIYVANLRSVSAGSGAFSLRNPFWKMLLSFFNLGSACFVLSILTTRFVYPMLSLEGKQFWALGLAPIRRETLVWEKYWLCWATSLALTLSLTLLSNWVLDVEPWMMALSLLTVVFMSFALTSLSVGLGALTPNFKEDNPARIANGMGGTMNIFLSLGYVALVIAIELWPAFLLATGRWSVLDERRWLLGVLGAALFVVNAAAIVIPMRLGLRRWRELEF
ncbi:MAG: hypothetical protein NTW86_04580 [Candidatus Sumerlaeota bacterium]|nr:hypothetical protein [Candidatus Sumerlaeota bacterium]